MRIVIGMLLLASFNAPAQQDTTPFQCDDRSVYTLPWYRAFCETVEFSTLNSGAKIRGQPRPSRKVIDLPAYGSVEGKRTGVVCMGGLGMARLPNGWQQLTDRDGNYLRCQDL